MEGVGIRLYLRLCPCTTIAPPFSAALSSVFALSHRSKRYMCMAVIHVYFAEVTRTQTLASPERQPPPPPHNRAISFPTLLTHPLFISLLRLPHAPPAPPAPLYAHLSFRSTVAESFHLRAGSVRAHDITPHQLEILSQAKDPQAVQPHLRKCFDNLVGLTFGDEPGSIDIHAMISSEGEKVPLGKNLKARGYVEDWLSQARCGVFIFRLDLGGGHC